MSNPLSVFDVTGQPNPDAEPAALIPAGPNGTDRAARALLALGVDNAAEVLKHLPEDQAETLTAAIAKLGHVEQAELDRIAGDLVADAGGVDAVSGGIGYTRDLLERVVGAERAGELIDRFLGGEVRPFDFMRSMSPEQIADLLEGESPQTVALVAGNVKPALSGRILDQLGPVLQADVAHRIALMTTQDPELLDDLDRGLREKAELGGNGGDDAGVSGVDTLAQILSGSGRATERQVLGGLEAIDPQLAADVRARLFTFEDLVKLTDKDLQQVLREIDTKDLVLALRGSDPALLERVLANMSQRAGETLQEDLEMQTPVKRALVEDAQTKVVTAIRELDEAGSITLPTPDFAVGGDESEELL